MKKFGYDSYLFMRPGEFCGDFVWEGFDGSKLYAHGFYRGYGSLKGDAVNKVKAFVNDQKDGDSLCLWGVGNHGGGPSKIDLEAINEYIKEADCEIIHSTPENYFSAINREGLKVVSESLIPCMIGCYTSMCRIKQANRRLENSLAVTEKIMSYAAMQTDFEYNGTELDEAKKALAFCQFHDILPGSAIKAVEEDSLRTLAYGEEISDRLYNRAFFKLSAGQPVAEAGTIPILVFNPHPYEIEGEFEIGFMLENQNWNEEEVTLATVYDEHGNIVPSQNEKPDCTFNLDWIQKVCFRAKIAPAAISRFNCKLATYKKSELAKSSYDSEFITVKNDRMTVVINRKTGLIQEYTVNGKQLLINAGVIEVYADNEDPWGMTVKGFKNSEGCFRLMTDSEANEFMGYPEEKLPNVRIVEDGDVRIKVQSSWVCKSNKAVLEYTIPKKGAYIDVDIRLYSNEPNKAIKLRFDTAYKGTPFGQTAFGAQKLFADGREDVFQKWCGIRSETGGVCVLNNGIYGGRFSEDSIRLTLLRTPVYSAHPINDRPIAPHNRFHDHIDMGERSFSVRITCFGEHEKEAQIFNEAPRLISFFPSGNGERKESGVIIDDPYILLSSIRRKDGKYVLTLYNSADSPRSAKIKLPTLGRTIEETFGNFEFKFVEI